MTDGQLTDAALIDEALGALLARQRSAEIDASYASYDKHPVDEPDEWGNLAEFRQAAAATYRWRKLDSARTRMPCGPALQGAAQPLKPTLYRSSARSTFTGTCGT